MDQENRVIVLIDMDCFYCQVEEKLNPELKGKPIAVVQYNPWQGGGIIAVNYVARAKGVTRHMRGKEAKEKCPDIELPSVPCTRGKADISRKITYVELKYTILSNPFYLFATCDTVAIISTNLVDPDSSQDTQALLGYEEVGESDDEIKNYLQEDNVCSDTEGEGRQNKSLCEVPFVDIKAVFREAGKEVARVLQKFTPLLERASIDEAYLDITASVEERLHTLNFNTVNTNMMPNTFALGYDCIEEFIADVHTHCMDNIDFDYEHAKRLLVGAVIVSEIRAAVYEETASRDRRCVFDVNFNLMPPLVLEKKILDRQTDGQQSDPIRVPFFFEERNPKKQLLRSYRCSAGIAHNKILAKLVCGFNKPNKQTILPKHSVNILYSTLPLKKVKHLGGKFGDTVCGILKISKMGELQKYTEKELQSRFDDKNGSWLYNIARGIDLEPVQVRLNPKSIGCCKQFRGKAALLHLDSLRKWLKDLGDEIEDRLEQDALENNRTPKQMVVSFSTQMPDRRDTSSSRSYNFVADDELCSELFSSKALELLLESSEGVKVKENESNRKLKAPITFLGISVGKFEDISDTKKTKRILDYFSASTSKDPTDKPKNKTPEDKSEDKSKAHLKNNGREYLMQKFFKASESQSIKLQNDDTKGPEVSKDVQTKAETETGNPQITETLKSHNTPFGVVESTLDEQESFFAKILNQNVKKDPRISNIDSEEKTRPITPFCDVVKCEDETNDTDYSGSTIINEIDKSMALFDDDPEDVNRLTSMRQLLNSSKVLNDEEQAVSPGPEPNLHQGARLTPQIEPQTVDMFDCPECGKSIPIVEVEMHSDYHLALKLRDEDRQQVRQDKQDKTIVKRKSNETKKKKVPEDSNNKNKSISSIASFLVKINSNVPTEACSECGKRIPVEKFMEHLDFHEAQKLNRKLNKRISPQFSGTSVKRKRISTSPAKNIKPCRSNNSLFK